MIGENYCILRRQHHRITVLLLRIAREVGIPSSHDQVIWQNKNLQGQKLGAEIKRYCRHL